MSKQKSNPQKGVFPVLGMSCAACAGSAESIIAQQEGVVEASVNFATGNLTVFYANAQTSPEVLQKALQSAGFDLLLENENEQQETLEAIHNQNFQKLQKKTIAAAILSIPVVIIGMFFMHIPYANEIMLLFSTPVVLWFGRDFFISAFRQAKNRMMNMDTLVALSTGIAYLFSLFNMLFQDFWMKRGIHPHVYFEASAVIITFILLGKWLEEKAKGNTSTAIKKLMGLQPKTVTIIDENSIQKSISIDEVTIGHRILVKPGEQIAVDGVVFSGESFVDESMLSGEPIAVLKKEGEKVYAGTLNQKGSFQFEASKVGKETLLAQIITKVQEAQGSKAPVQKLMDKIARIFVPTVICIALITFVFWLIFGEVNALEHAILAAVTVLIIACPCALGLATPTAIMVGVGKGAENGILIKDAESLELAQKIDTVVLDKTGTITEGKPQVTDMFWLNSNPIDKSILYSIELQSEHPLAEAVVKHLKNREVVDLTHFESTTGKGVQAKYKDCTYFVGNKKWLQALSIHIPKALEEKAEIGLKTNQTVIWFANEKEVLGVVFISDQIKSTSVQAIQTLKKIGIEVFMLTGDNQATAQSIAIQTGIENYRAESLPEDKAIFVKQLQDQGKIVAMVGDGINDSTALATADVSIAMGKGSDIAMEVAKITIISSDLSKIPQAIQLSKQTVTTIKQNLFWAFIYNLIGIPIAAGILYPFNGFLLNPMLAGAAMALSSVSVVTNSLRLKRK